jgi:predicted RNA-binding protein YlxR (DUF448 family)
MGRNLPGRGAWVCKGSNPCLDLALRKGGLARALRTTSGHGAANGEIPRLLRYASDAPKGAQ